MTYALSNEEINKVRDLVSLLDYRINSGGDGEEPTLNLDGEDQARVAQLVWDIRGFIS